jgi:hypothetical protein
MIFCPANQEPGIPEPQSSIDVLRPVIDVLFG